MTQLHNKVFDAIRIGDSASYSRTATKDDIRIFAYVSGDVNPVHLDAKFAAGTPFKKPIAHGMWGASLISTVLGTQLPGPGTIYLGQELRFKAPVYLGDKITASVTVVERDEKRKQLSLSCECVNQDGRVVIEGKAQVIAPTESVTMAAPIPPAVKLVD